jgi:hypothetical protein
MFGAGEVIDLKTIAGLSLVNFQFPIPDSQKESM